MALRIGQPQAASQPAVMAEEPPPAEVPELPAEEMLPEEPMEPRLQMAKVSPESARYFGPEYRCGSCTHFMQGMESGECEIVAGPIDEMGVCGLFEPDAGLLADPMGEVPMEMPIEAPEAATEIEEEV